MKKLTIIILTVCLLLANTGCSAEPAAPTTVPTVPTVPSATEESVSAETTVSTVPSVSVEFPLLTFSAPIAATEHHAKDGTLLFTYTCQNIALLLEDPQVADAIMIDLLNLVDYENSPAASILADAKAAYSGQNDWIPFYYSTLLSPARFDAGVLSLYGTHALYDGSPRSTAANLSVTYDLLSGRQLTLKDVLVTDFSADILSQKIVDALAVFASGGMLYSDYAYVISEMFSTNRPIETWYLSEEGLCFYFAPYEIAPYSAGTIVAEIPYSELIGTIRDDYFPTETTDSIGKLSFMPFQDADLAQFDQFAELILDKDGSKYLIYTDGYLRNVRIEKGVLSEDGNFHADATVFLAPSLCSGDAIMLQASADTAQCLRLTCEEKGSTVSYILIDLLTNP